MSEAKHQQLPHGWTFTPLSSLATHHSGDSKVIKGKLRTSAAPGLFPAYSATGQDVWRDAFAREGDAIVVSAVGARCGKCFLASGKWSAIANTHVVWPEQNGIHRKFLWYRINDEEFWVRSGTAQPFVVVRKTLEKPFILPPLAEQERIADALDELLSDLDAAVAALERARAKLKLYRASVLKAAVEGALTADWRAQHPDAEPASALLERILVERRRRWEESQLEKFKAADKTPPKNWKAKYPVPVPCESVDLPRLPSGWVVTSMDAISSRITSGSRDWQQYYGSGTGTFIMAQNVRPGRFDMSFRQAVNPPPSDSSCERSRVELHDLLVTIVGANTGDVCRITESVHEHYVCQSVALMRPVDSTTSSYLDLYFNSMTGGQLHFRRCLYGAGRPHLSFDQLRVTPVLLPPVDEQTAVAEAVEDQLAVIDHLESDIDSKLKSAQALRQSILRDAFAGKLVPQDPNDEPASELLKRIAAEREERAKLAAAAKRKPKAAKAGKAHGSRRARLDVR